MTLRSRGPLRSTDATAVARLWKAAGGRPEVELGALEPLLWRESNLRPADLVQALVATGMRVTMTTNGSLLARMAGDLAEARLSLIRISWHTTDPTIFREMSGHGGHGDYAAFKAGITAAADAGLRVSFNRVLLQGLTRDLPEQLDFVENYGFRLKLYDLMWSPELAGIYGGTYQDWRSVVREYVLPRTKRVERVHGKGTRDRIRFHIANGAVVEVKVSRGVDRSESPCVTCVYRDVCLEEFGDYMRVEPELDVYACYLRRDIGFNLRRILESGEAAGRILRERVGRMIGRPECEFFSNSRLRYIVVPFCNFNCVVPGTTISWCHKTSGNYSFPGRPRSLNGEATSVAEHSGA